MRVTRRKLEEAGIGMSGLSSTSGMGTYGLARPPSYVPATKGKGADKERKQPAQAGTADIKIAGGGRKKKKKRG